MGNANFQHILDSLPEKPPRSQLEPYRVLIEKLRRRGRTYREIVSILAEKCSIHVSLSTLHDFVRVQSEGKSKRKNRDASVEPNKPNRAAIISRMNSVTPTSDDVRERISALKRRSANAVQPTPKLFDYDPDEPLRLPTDIGKPDSGE